MRDIFLEKVSDFLENNNDSILVTADLGFGLFEDLASNFPSQFLNVGVAEQFMSSFACGYSLLGGKVITYSIGIFPTLRCLEQIRNDIAYHNSNVMIVSSGAGFSYGALGPSHHATEDIGFVKSIPNIRICSPASQYECSECITPLLNHQSPSYLRLDKYSSSQLQSFKPHSLEDLFVYHRGQASKVLLLAHGTTLDLYLSILSLYPELSPFISIISCPFLPLSDSLISELNSHSALFIVEEHQFQSGFGSSVLCFASQNNVLMPIHLYGLESFADAVGSQIFLRDKYLPSASDLASQISLYL